MLRDREVYECYDCGWKGDGVDSRTVPDDRDQMYGRPLSGTMDVYCCPECGSEEIGYADSDD